MTSVLQKHRLLLVLLMGLAIRLPFLSWPGTSDMEAFRLWGAKALHGGFTHVYTLRDTDVLTLALQKMQGMAPQPHVRTLTELGVSRGIPDYPPGGVLPLELSAGLSKFLQGGRLQRGPLLNACLNFFPVLFSMGIAVALWLLLPEAGESRRLAAVSAFWLNPAILLTSPILGYQDPIFAFFALMALLFLYRRRYMTSAVFLALSCLIKPQPLILIPIAVTVAFADGGWALARRSSLAVFFCGVAGLLPFVATRRALGIFAGMYQQALMPDLSEQALNVWWLVGTVAQGLRAGSLRPLAPIVQLCPRQLFLETFGLPPGWLSFVSLAVFTVLMVRFLITQLRQGHRLAIFWAAALELYAFTMLSLTVHENHLFGFFVYLLPLLALADRSWWKIYGSLTAIYLLNLFLFEGLGQGWNQNLRLRSLTIVDITLPVALANVVIFALILGTKHWLFDRARPQPATRIQ